MLFETLVTESVYYQPLRLLHIVIKDSLRVIFYCVIVPYVLGMFRVWTSVTGVNTSRWESESVRDHCTSSLLDTTIDSPSETLNKLGSD